MRCRPSTHELVITHAQCAWVSDQCALTMLHPLPTRAGDRTPFEQSGQVCAFLSPPPICCPIFACTQPGRLHQQQCHTHRQARMWKQTHLNRRLRWRRQGRMLHGPTDASQCRRKFCWLMCVADDHCVLVFREKEEPLRISSPHANRILSTKSSLYVMSTMGEVTEYRQ